MRWLHGGSTKAKRLAFWDGLGCGCIVLAFRQSSVLFYGGAAPEGTLNLVVRPGSS